MPVTWPDEIDEVLGGDLTAALAYITPAGGSVVTAVAPVGARDREAGTVTFTTSLGFGKKLERMQRDPGIALAYHARKHGFATGERFVLVQGDAEVTLQPDRAYLEDDLGPRAERFLGPRKRGFFWDRWLREYYADRVAVLVTVRRIVTWPDLACGGDRAVFGADWPASPPAAQRPPARGSGPRIDSARAAARLGGLPYVLLSYVGADGYPVAVPVRVAGTGADGLQLAAERGLLPLGGRRAGLLGHDYGPELVAIAARQHTGWLEVPDDSGSAVYAPHTEQGFRAPANKTVLMLANGLLAKRGLRRARRRGLEFTRG